MMAYWELEVAANIVILYYLIITTIYGPESYLQAQTQLQHQVQQSQKRTHTWLQSCSPLRTKKRTRTSRRLRHSHQRRENERHFPAQTLSLQGPLQEGQNHLQTLRWSDLRPVVEDQNHQSLPPGRDQNHQTRQTSQQEMILFLFKFIQ